VSHVGVYRGTCGGVARVGLVAASALPSVLAVAVHDLDGGVGLRLFGAHRNQAPPFSEAVNVVARFVCRDALALQLTLEVAVVALEAV
jgi:hypothetical protein